MQMFNFQEVVVFFQSSLFSETVSGLQVWAAWSCFFSKVPKVLGGTLVGDVRSRNLVLNVKSILYDVQFVYYATCLLMLLLMMLGLRVQSMDKMHVG